MMPNDEMRDYTHIDYEKEKKRNRGIIMLIVGLALIIISAVMPFVAPVFGYFSWGSCILGLGLLVGGLVGIVSGLKKNKPQPPPKDMGLDELMQNPPQ